MERVTRQYAEVLTAGDGEARVGRQYVEVLCAATIYAPTPTNDLNLSDTLTVRQIRYVSIGHDLNLSQSPGCAGPHYIQLQTSAGIKQQLDVQHLAVYRVAISNELNLDHFLGKQIPVSVTSTLTLIDEVEAVDQAGIPAQDLGLSQEIIAYVVHPTRNDLALSDEIRCSRIAARRLTNDLQLGQSLAYELHRIDTTKQYTPFVGAGADANYTPPTIAPPVLGHAHLTLTYPFASPTLTVVLRNPEFGNLDRLTFNRINRKTRGGTLIISGDPTWPKVQTLQVRFTYLDADQAAALLNFLNLSLGREIGLLDHEGRQWRGVITTPDAEISNPGPHDWSTGFDFEGMLA